MRRRRRLNTLVHNHKFIRSQLRAVSISQSRRSLPSRYVFAASKAAVARASGLWQVVSQPESLRIGMGKYQMYAWMDAQTKGAINSLEPITSVPKFTTRPTPAPAKSRLDTQPKKVATCLRQCCSPSVNVMLLVSSVRSIVKTTTLTASPMVPCKGRRERGRMISTGPPQLGWWIRKELTTARQAMIDVWFGVTQFSTLLERARRWQGFTSAALR